MLTRLATMNDLMVGRATKVGASMEGDRKTAAHSGPGSGFYDNLLSHKRIHGS